MSRRVFGGIVETGIAVTGFFAAKTAFAASISLPNPLGATCTTITCPVNGVINFLFYLSFPICAIMVLWGGFMMATSAGDPEKFGTGRKTILYAAIGFMVILLAKGAGGTVQKFLGM